MAIAELASVINSAGNWRRLFNHEFAGKRRVPAGSARDDLDFLERLELFRRDIHLVQKDSTALLTDAPESGVADGARLLKNLLEHEMLVAAFFRHDRVPEDVL